MYNRMKNNLHYYKLKFQIGMSRFFPDLYIRTQWKGMPINLRKSLNDLYVFKEIFLEDEYLTVVKQVKRSPKVIIDLGAHIGLTSLYFHHHFPEAQFICVEPVEESYQVLNKNMSIVKDYRALNSVIADKEGTCNIYCYSWWSSCTISEDINNKRIGSISRPEGKRKLEKRQVNTISLPAIIEKYHIGKIDLLKIDIEGAEKQLFEGDVSWLQNVELIAIELHEKYIEVDGILTTLDKNGFYEIDKPSNRVRIFKKNLG